MDPGAAHDVEPNVLYRCALVPMRRDGGFITVSVTPVRFKATVQSVAGKEGYKVRVLFGNKQYYYSPMAEDPSRNSIGSIANTLRTRLDLANPCQVAEDFITAASTVNRLYRQSLQQ